MLAMPQTHRERALLLATGQVTSYGSGTGVDDGALKKGIVKAYTILTAGQYAGTTNITINSKTDAHSNNCVEDNNTGLMWSRKQAASVGPNSNGTIPWTTNVNGEGIFPYVAAANAALLAGYNDWRIPNIHELGSLVDEEAPTGAPNAAFTSFTLSLINSSNTDMGTITKCLYWSFDLGIPGTAPKTSNRFCLLVRGGR